MVRRYHGASRVALSSIQCCVHYFLSFSASPVLSALTSSVTRMPCTSKWRIALFPSEVGLNLAAARVASAIFRPWRDNGAVSGLRFFDSVPPTATRGGGPLLG